jgi:putative aldouronate transport system permease protein
MERAEIMDTYIMTAGVYRAGYSVATAIGVFKSVVGLILLFATNAFFRLLGEEGIV